MEVSGKKRDTDDEEENVENFHKLCDLCESDNVITPANGFCKECEEYMCTACFRQHTRAKSCRHHVSLDINSFSEACLRSNASAIKCKQHDGETVKYYCYNHEVVGCGDCMVIWHKACDTKNIKNLSDNFDQSEEYSTLMRKLENLKSGRRDFKKEIYNHKKMNKLMHERALKDIRQFRLDINGYLDKAEALIIAQAYDIMEENETLLTKLNNYCKRLSTELTKITEKLDKNLYKDNILFIHAVECKRKVTASEIYISEMKSKPIKEYTFACDQRLGSLVSSKGKLGTYIISTSAVFFNKTTEKAADEGSRSTLAVKASVKPTQIFCNDCGDKIPAGTSKFCQRCQRNVWKGNLEKGTPVSVWKKGDSSQIRIGSRVKLKTAEYGIPSYRGAEYGIPSYRGAEYGMPSYGAQYMMPPYAHAVGITGTVTGIFENGTVHVTWDNGGVSVVKGPDELSLI